MQYTRRRPRALSEVMGAAAAVEYHVGPVIRAVHDDPALVAARPYGLMHPDLHLALGEAFREVT